jgi:hypothetical protein
LIRLGRVNRRHGRIDLERTERGEQSDNKSGFQHEQLSAAMAKGIGEI